LFRRQLVDYIVHTDSFRIFSPPSVGAQQPGSGLSFASLLAPPVGRHCAPVFARRPDRVSPNSLLIPPIDMRQLVAAHAAARVAFADGSDGIAPPCEVNRWRQCPNGRAIFRDVMRHCAPTAPENRS
jgi:hypothetical protein